MLHRFVTTFEEKNSLTKISVTSFYGLVQTQVQNMVQLLPCQGCDHHVVLVYL
jgi:hypothetical protein